VLPEDIHLVQEHLKDQEDNLKDQVDHQGFQDVQAVPNQEGNSLAFHRIKDLLVDILVDDHQFHFQAVNQREDQVLVEHRVDDQKGFQQGQAVDILVVDLGNHRVGFQDKDLPDIRVVSPENPKVLDILVVDQVDQAVNKFLEAIPVGHRNLVARDILVRGQELEIFKDLAVVQVLKDQVDIQDQEVFQDLEVSKAEYLPAAILVDQEHKDQEDFRVAQAHKDQKVIQVDQKHKNQEAFRVIQVRKDQEAIRAAQVRKDQEDSQVDQERKGQENSRVLVIR